MVKEPLEIRCQWCGDVIRPGQRFAKTKEPVHSLRGMMKMILCEKCGKEREKKEADIDWDVMDEDGKAIDIDSHWVNVSISA